MKALFKGIRTGRHFLVQAAVLSVVPLEDVRGHGLESHECSLHLDFLIKSSDRQGQVLFLHPGSDFGP